MITPLGTLLDSRSLGYHFYADDIQIYISLDRLSRKTVTWLVCATVVSRIGKDEAFFCYLELHSNLKKLIGLNLWHWMTQLLS